MTANALKALGTKIQRASAAYPDDTGYADIAEMKRISLSIGRDVIDVTTLDSNGWKNKLATLAEMKDVSLDGFFIPTDDTLDGTAGLLADLKNGTERRYKFIFPDTAATFWKWPALVTDFNTDVNVGDAIGCSFTLTPSRQPDTLT